MARALVIGGTSLIGRPLVELLLARGDHVVVMHRGTGTPFGRRVAEIQCDRNDVGAVHAALAGQRFDVIYDNVYDWQRGTTAEQVAAVPTAAAEGLARYVYMSSIAVYEGRGECDEDAPLLPADHPNTYGAHKAESERALFALHRATGLPVATLRPAFVYGPHNPFDREAFFWDRLLAGRPIVIPEDGARTMQWVHALDVARAAVLAATTDAATGGAFNLASWPPITQVEFVRLLARVAGTPAELVPVPRDRIQALGGELFVPPLYFGAYLDIPPLTVRTERARTVLGLEPTPLEDGMRETFDWYRGQDRAAPDFAWEDRLLAEARPA